MTLDQFAIKFGTDKSSLHHNYCHQYEFHLSKYRYQKIVLWNGGFGGYEFPDRGGGDTKMWREFFPKANIVVTDIHYKHQLNIPGVHVRQGAQDDEEFWLKILGETGPPDIFIDDMSHVNDLTIKTFEIVFPLLKSGGTYIIEDIEGSWYPDHGFGGTKYLSDKNHPSIINFCRDLLNELNHKYNGAEVEYGISSMSFISNSVIITKK